MPDNIQLLKNLLEISEGLSEEYSAIRAKLQLSPAEYELLAHLSSFDLTRRVPELALEQNLSRQRVQVLVNDLTRRGLVALLENPEHARSPLISLTEKGARIFNSDRQTLESFLRSLSLPISANELEFTTRTLQDLRREFRRAHDRSAPSSKKARAQGQ